MKKVKNNILGYSYVMPALVFYFIFFLYPIVYIFYISFFRAKFYDVSITKFIGLENYIDFFTNPYVGQIFKNTFIYIILAVFLKVILGLLLALLLHKNTVINKITRTFIFIPTAMSMVAAGLIWNFIYNPRYGLINNLLNFLHLDFLTNQWLGNPKTALICILLIDVWQSTGFSMILLVAGIQNIPKTIFEAGRIDGTNNFTENIYITIPLIKNVFITVILFIITAAFKVFEYIFVTTQGGPFMSTHTLSTYMYSVGFQGFNLTGGASISVVLFIISFIASGIFLYSSRFTKEG